MDTLLAHRKFLRRLLEVRQSSATVATTGEEFQDKFFVCLSNLLHLVESSLWSQLVKSGRFSDDVERAVANQIGDPDLAKWISVAAESGSLGDVPTALRHEVHLLCIDVFAKIPRPSLTAEKAWSRIIEHNYIEREHQYGRSPKVVVRFHFSTPVQKSLATLTTETVNYLIHSLAPKV